MSYAIANPLPVFVGQNGLPLQGGKVFFGAVDENPETVPVSVYWDEDMTQPAAQPVRIVNGMPSRDGVPAPVFIAVDHSLTIRDSANRLLYYTRRAPGGSVSGSSASEFFTRRTDAPVVATAGQAVIPVPGGFPANTGGLVVIQDGRWLSKSEYAENVNGTITLNVPCFGGEEFTFLVGGLTAGEALCFATPEAYGADPTGVSDATAALTALFAATERVQLMPGATYKFSAITIPAGMEIRGRGAILRSDGSLTGSSVSVTVGDNVKFDDLVITTPGTETNENVVQLGDNVRGNLLEVRADSQRENGGIVTEGQDVRIDTVRTVNIDRPLHLLNTSTSAQTTGSRIGYLDVTGYVRAFRADFCSFHLGGIWARGRSANASKTSGHNGVLIVGCANWYVGDWIIEGAGEHAFRIGGSPGTYAKTKDFVIGDGLVVGCGGCALKINPTLLVSPGVTETCDRGTIGYITGVDVGDGSLSGNEELLRITHGRDISIAGAYALIRDQTASGQYALQINDCDGVRIGELGGDALNAGFINFDETSDVDGVLYFGGNVSNVYIDRLIGACAGVNAIGVTMGARTVGGIYIGDMSITGYTTNLLRWVNGSLTSEFSITGRVYGAVAPTIDGAPASPNLLVDVRYGAVSSRGRADKLRGTTAAQELTTASMVSTDTAPRGLFLNNSEGTAALGAYGSGLELSRVGSGRRGAGVFAKQTGAAQENTGLALLTGSTTTGSDALVESMSIDHTGVLWVRDGVTAPSARAGFVGLYIDAADGDLKAIFGDGFVRTIGADS